MPLYASLLLVACSLRPSPSGTDTPSDDTAPPDDSATPTEPSLCPSGIAATDAPVIWTASGSELSFVDGTGASRGIFSFEKVSADHSLPMVQVDGDRVGVLALDHEDGAELALLGLDGSVVSRAAVPGAYSTDFWLGADSVAYSPGRVELDASKPWMDGVLLQNEDTVVLDGWIPKGPVVDGTLAVCATDDSACSWLDLATGEHSGSLSIDAWWTGKHLVWIDGTELVVATSSSEQRIDLGADIVLDWNANAVLVGSPSQAEAIVSLDTGDRVSIGLPPDGWRAFTDVSPHNYCPNADWKLASDDRDPGRAP